MLLHHKSIFSSYLIIVECVVVLFSGCWILTEGFAEAGRIPVKINMSSLFAATEVEGHVFMAISVDGMISGKDNDMEWLHSQPVVEGEDFGFAAFLKSMDAMVMGRGTFETVAGFGKEAWAYGDLPIVVWTSDIERVKVPEWLPPSVNVQSNPTPDDLWKELKEKGYRSVYIDGGKTIQSFLEAGLIHHLCLTRIPIILGEGSPLFDGTIARSQRPLKHVSTTSHPNGFVISNYDVIYNTS